MFSSYSTFLQNSCGTVDGLTGDKEVERPEVTERDDVVCVVVNVVV